MTEATEETTENVSALPSASLSSSLLLQFKFVKKIFEKYLSMVLVFFYLVLVLWSVLLQPTMDIEVHWIPTSFFTTAKQSTCIIRMQQISLTLIEAMFFSTLAMFGYFRGCGGVAGGEHEIYGDTLANFEEAMMGVRHKYYWLLLMPWLMTFAQNWLQNLLGLLLLFSGTAVYEAHNFYTSFILILACYAVQALLASEMVCMALNGWCAMRNINEENMKWEQQKRLFNGSILDIVLATPK